MSKTNVTALLYVHTCTAPLQTRLQTFHSGRLECVLNDPTGQLTPDIPVEMAISHAGEQPVPIKGIIKTVKNRPLAEGGYHTLISVHFFPQNHEIQQQIQNLVVLFNKQKLAKRLTQGFAQTAALAESLDQPAVTYNRHDIKQQLQKFYSFKQPKEVQFFESIFLTSLDAIVIIRHNGTIYKFNAAAEKLFQWQEKDVIDKDFAEWAIPTHLRSRHREALVKREASLKHRSPPTSINQNGRRFEVVGQQADGQPLDLDITITTVEHAGKMYHVGIIRDMTKHNMLMRTLEQALAEAESFSRAKSEFLANMSHEIRSPMNAIMGMTDLVLDTQLDPNQRANLEIVRNSSEHLLSLLNAILDLSKLEAGKILLEQVPFNLRNQIEESCVMLATKAQEKGIDLFVDMPPECPEFVRGDPLRLQQIILNLTSNAIKFTQKGEVIVRVQPAQDTNDTHGIIPLRFSVTDTGIGIPKTHLHHIFERFSQVDGSTTRQYGGTGLGLSIVKHLVTLMNAEIHVESREQEGSLFYFTIALPLAGPSDQHEEINPEGYPPLPGTNYYQKVRVLLGDEHATGRSIVKKLLRGLGAWVQEVEDPIEFMAAVSPQATPNAAFDIVILDHELLSAVMESVAAQTLPNILGQKTLVITPVHYPKKTANPELGWRLLTKPVRLHPLLEQVDQILGRTVVHSRKSKPVVHRRGKSPRRILVIDDLPNNQKLAEQILSKAGHSVEKADNGRRALTTLGQTVFDLVFMDIKMPDMDGYETTRQIRQEPHIHPDNRDVPIIALTAHAMKSEETKCLGAGMDGYLSKPFRADALLSMVDRYGKKRAIIRQRSTDKAQQPLLKPVVDLEKATAGREFLCRERTLFTEKLPELLQQQDICAVREIAKILSLAAHDVGATTVKLQAVRLGSAVLGENWGKAATVYAAMKSAYEKTLIAWSQETPLP